MDMLTPPQRVLRDRARALAESAIAPHAAETDRTEAYPWYAVEALRGAGFMGMTLPEAHGGLGASYLDAAIVIEEVAKVCAASARIVVESNMGAIGAIMQYGSPAQRSLAAGMVLAGDKPAICITEPEAGSAATEMRTRAERRGGKYVLNGRKHWITGAGVSRLHLIFARVFEGAAERGIGGFIVVADGKGGPRGLVVGKREPAMGVRGIPECEVLFQDLEVAEDMLLLPPEGLGRGFASLMNAYNAQRLGAATVALGIAEGAFQLALGYAKEREQFGRPIGEFQGLQWMLADMSIQLDASRNLIHAAARTAAPFPDMAAVARAKVFAAEMANKVTSDALQVFGSAGYSRARPLERMMRDARMFAIAGGTAQILRTQIASSLLGWKLPQTRDGYARAAARRQAAE